MANPRHRLAVWSRGQRALASLLFATGLVFTPVLSIAAEGDGKNFAWGTQVTRDNVAFEFQEAKYANLVVDSSSNDSPKQYKGNFVLLQVNVTNTADQPLFVRFQPLFRLIDASGALYEPHEMLTKLVNPVQEGQPVFGAPLAAGQTMQRRVLFFRAETTLSSRRHRSTQRRQGRRRRRDVLRAVFLLRFGTAAFFAIG
jgi:hypothetical protein